MPLYMTSEMESALLADDDDDIPAEQVWAVEQPCNTEFITGKPPYPHVWVEWGDYRACTRCQLKEHGGIYFR